MVLASVDVFGHCVFMAEVEAKVGPSFLARLFPSKGDTKVREILLYIQHGDR